MAKKSLTEAAAAVSKQNFSLNKYREKKGISAVSKYKEQKWIPLSDAFSNVTSIPGIPLGHIVIMRGHSDTGKTTAMIEGAVSAQRRGILPVFIITEMKWNWQHAIDMGFEVNEVVDEETGEIVDYDGFFIYVDRQNINSIEDVATFIGDLLDDQKAGDLPYDLMFFWDSVGSVPCELSITSNKNNNEWNAGAMSTQFGNNVNQRITLSRKESYPYTNTLVAINKVWTMKADSPMGQPKLQNKGGMAMWYDSTFVITFGNITNAGTSKVKAIKEGKQVEFAKRVNIQIDKNHINGITTRGKLIMTPHGFIKDSDSDLKNYKKEFSNQWAEIMGGSNFDLVEEEPQAAIQAPAYDKEPE